MFKPCVEELESKLLLSVDVFATPPDFAEVEEPDEPVELEQVTQIPPYDPYD